ncbi:putative bifunctional diguanylate cyclase/phosphodiesterase [Limimaricola pyoseonensis]|uniref:PAS domain S-box-containing protein/diguanylate cyclase (GGDEF) domain-containing protein n=1 Tax=Limimaricola pyoseonensis TaxID=521013 RepID=A0A1G7FZA2_9RHOB|nr:EAL domain-containing protein [Limimaricola pyoseonensis]SDE81204.1 PAS domain S-box-containing protein/diguanylate cyclase (GGDEF) domain-containing protein [Limimaricola pyoseonensis]
MLRVIMYKLRRSLRLKVQAILMLGLGLCFSLVILQQSSSRLGGLMEFGEAASRDRTVLAASLARHGIEMDEPGYLAAIRSDLAMPPHDEDAAAAQMEAPAIAGLRITGTDGGVLERFAAEGAAPLAPGLLDAQAAAAIELCEVQQARHGELFVVTAPVMGGGDGGGQPVPIGTISIAWDHGHLRAGVFEATAKTALLGLAAALAVIALLGATVQRMVLEPLAQLARAVRRIQANGDLSQMPAGVLERCDEIGSLAVRFQSLLAQSNAQILARREQLDTALEQMAQGLCLFDSHHRLVISNRRLEEIYGLAEGELEEGMGLDEVLAACRRAGNYDQARVEEIKLALGRTQGGGEPLRYLEAIRDGRLVSVVRVPLPRGGWVATFEDVTERKRTEAQVEHMAQHDALTGLPNRRRFRDKLDEALAQSARGRQMAVLALDLDNFKPVNDTLGHSVGDALLQEVAQRLRGCLRQSSTVARLGGDEFAIIERDIASPGEPGRLAERVVAALGVPYEIEGHQIVIGTSIGISIAPPDGVNPEELLKAADLALYRAKADGRGTYRFFEPQMDARMQKRRALELDLRRALAEGELQLHYQPIVNLETGRVSCLEALLRWPHESRGQVSPGEFIPLAEEIGLIGQIGAWVLREACASAARWPAEVRVAVNLSPLQFRSLTLVAEVEAALAESGLAPQRLELEITEAVLLQHSEQTLAILKRLRGLGVRISMDDFGTGYSSLGYLRTFPFDKIKIDRSFIRDVVNHGDALAIVRAISSMGASLGMVTTAEGVETSDQLERLRSEGCTEVQGFYFSPAVCGAEVMALLERIGRTPGELPLPLEAAAGLRSAAG